MKREILLQAIQQNPHNIWDIIVIGGGATGLGAALEAASRGYKTLLLEQADFAKGTSSRSTKLVHGGVRYLAQGDIALVREALKERGILTKNAPHLVRKQAFLVPSYRWFDAPFYGTGLKVYDWLAGRLGLGKSYFVSHSEVLNISPNLRNSKLKGGIVYYDGQFDDARLAINLAQTITEQGGVVLNYMKVTNLLKSLQDKVGGVICQDLESGKTYKLGAKIVINATGIFVDDILHLDQPKTRDLVRPSQGVHLVLDQKFLKSDTAIMIPKTSDGRVLFLVPWHGRVVVGTTDTPIAEASLEPKALEEEIEFILQTAQQYLEKKPTRADVLSVFAGLRPLAAPKDNEGQKTKEISRGHHIIVSESNLLSVIGGKWTTYRKMGEDVINQAAKVAVLKPLLSVSANLPLRGYTVYPKSQDSLSIYGSDRHHIRQLIAKKPSLANKLHPRLPYMEAEVVWAVEQEMARKVEDVLARRTRALLLDAKASIEAAPRVAQLMAESLGYSDEWKAEEIESYQALAQAYCL